MPASRKPNDLAPLWIAAGAMLLLVFAATLMLQRPVSRQVAALQGRPSRTPYPTETPRPTRTPTPTITPTLKETLSPRSIVQTVRALPALDTSTPDPAVTYVLKAWTEDDAALMVHELDARRREGKQNALVGERFASVTLLHEMMLRYPETAERLTADGQIGLRNGQNDGAEMYGYTNVPLYEPLRAGLEQALNEGRAAYGGEKPWIVRRGFILVDAQDAPNLLNDGQNARILTLGLPENGRVGFARLFAVRPDPGGGFKVIPVAPAWETGEELTAVTVLDVNGNGMPEVVRTTQWQSADSPLCERRMWIFEWNGASFIELTPEPIEVKLDGSHPGTCRDFSYQGSPNGSYTITAETVETTTCGEAYDLTRRDVYEWDGAVYRRVQSETSAPPPAEPLFCALSWARNAGFNHPNAVAIIQGALRAWPARADQEWGPLSKNFYMLRLALWQVQLGREADAVALMRSLARMSETPPRDLPGRTAQAFVDAYDSAGLYQALLASQAVFDEGTLGAARNGATVPLGFEECCATYGVPFPYDTFFNFDPLAVTLGRSEAATTQAVEAWLAKNGVPAWAVIEADLDGDGRSDWLVGSGGDRLAALVRQDGGLAVLHLKESAPRTMTLTAYEPVPGAPWIAVGQAGGDLYAFHVENGAIVYDLRHIEAEYRFSGLEINAPFTIDRAEGNNLVVTYNGEPVAYRWNPALRRLVALARSPEGQEDRFTAAELALFRLNEPAGAEGMFKDLLDGILYEQVQVEGMAYDQPRPGFLRSHAGYLYALALELQGKEAEAAKAYTELWQYFPNSAYGLVARRKLGQ